MKNPELVTTERYYNTEYQGTQYTIRKIFYHRETLDQEKWLVYKNGEDLVEDEVLRTIMINAVKNSHNINR